jgi:chemotaxis protein MotB
MGGRIAFDPHSARLRPQAQQLVTTLAEMLRGHNTKIDIRGHATKEPLPFGTPYRDKLDLSYERARAVAEALVAAGVRRERIRIVAAGATEPLLRQAYDEERRAQNRRVEITVRESLVSEFSGDEVSFEEQVNNGQGK